MEVENIDHQNQSSYVQYLPAFYRDDDFTGRFLHIFEDILKSTEDIIDNLPFYFDTTTCPDSFVPWLSFWVGLTVDERLPETNRRNLIKSAVELYSKRGTKYGLAEYIWICTGVVPRIIEQGAGSDESKELDSMPHSFKIILDVPDPDNFDQDVINSIIKMQKPAHTAYILKINKQKSNI